MHVLLLLVLLNVLVNFYGFLLSCSLFSQHFFFVRCLCCCCFIVTDGFAKARSIENETATKKKMLFRVRKANEMRKKQIINSTVAIAREWVFRCTAKKTTRRKFKCTKKCCRAKREERKSERERERTYMPIN